MQQLSHDSALTRFDLTIVVSFGPFRLAWLCVWCRSSETLLLGSDLIRFRHYPDFTKIDKQPSVSEWESKISLKPSISIDLVDFGATTT